MSTEENPQDQQENIESTVAAEAPVDVPSDSEPSDADGDVKGDAPKASEQPATAEAKVIVMDAKKESAPKNNNALTVVFGVVAVVAIAVAAWSFVGNSVPAGTAAKINNSYLTEQDVDDYINQYRQTAGLSNDSTWAQMLIQQSSTPNSFRTSIINTLVRSKIVADEAERLGVSATDEQIDAEIEEIKTNMGITDDDTWQQTLTQYGTTEEKLREQERETVNQDNLYEAAVPKPDGYDEAKAASDAVEKDDNGDAKNDDDQDTIDAFTTLSSQWTEDCNIYLAKLLNEAQITIYPMPSDASYNVDMSLASSTSADSTSTDDSTDADSTDSSTSTDESATDESSADDSSSDDSTGDDSSSEESSN